MRLKMTETTRHEGIGYVAGDVVDVPDELGQRLLDQGLAEKSDAKETSLEQRARENPPPAPAEPGAAGYPGVTAPAITREDVAGLDPSQRPVDRGPSAPQTGVPEPQPGPQQNEDDEGRTVPRRRG